MPAKWSTGVTRRLGVELPVVLAPLGGGPSTPALAAAVSEAGGLGSLAGGYLSPDRLRAEIRAVRERTARPVAVNLFAVAPVPVDEDALARAMALVAPMRAELGLGPLERPTTWAQDVEEQVAVVVDERVPVVSFAFGLLSDTAMDRLRGAGAVIIGTATNVAEARALAVAGVDMVCAQGGEAGGHHGTWLGPARHSVIGTMALVPQVCDNVPLPVIAAGGIVDGRGVAAALCLGAGAAQMGTAFLRAPEAGTPAAHRRAVAGAAATDTALTEEVTGQLARGVRNRLMDRLRDEVVPPYPVMQTLTAELRRASAARDDPEYMSLWCGQAAPLAGDRPAAETVAEAMAGVRHVLTRLSAAAPD